MEHATEGGREGDEVLLDARERDEVMGAESNAVISNVPTCSRTSVVGGKCIYVCQCLNYRFRRGAASERIEQNKKHDSKYKIKNIAKSCMYIP